MYEFIQNKGREMSEELMRNFNLTELQLQNQFAVLRHCELIKGRKGGDGIFLVTFDYGE